MKNACRKIPWRKNVLVLVGAGYFVVLFVFGSLLYKGGMTVAEAYNVVEGPLMALIGGSLALSKDLVDDLPNPTENDHDVEV